MQHLCRDRKLHTIENHTLHHHNPTINEEENGLSNTALRPWLQASMQ
jgi:hypothetical protein